VIFYQRKTNTTDRTFPKIRKRALTFEESNFVIFSMTLARMANEKVAD